MKFWPFLFLLLLGCRLCAQTQLQPVAGLATQEVYDLLIDKRGFLWVGHELGISRFDGKNFKHFTHPQQASLSMTDLVEDAQGRIWCHNFSGQVFYIEKEKIEFFKAYDHAKEPVFPRMVIWGNELIITSVEGLFICDTKTLEGRYVKSSNSKETNIMSIGLLKDRAIGTDGKSWYSYNQSEGLKAIPVDSKIYEDDNTLRLHPGDYGDTLLLMVNPSGIIKKLIYDGHGIKEVSRQPLASFINTTTKNNEDTWIHTQDKSITLDGKKEIRNYNITDIIKGAQGHLWVSTLNKGLLVQYKSTLWKKVTVKEVRNNDFVRCINVLDTLLVMGTQNASLLVKDKIDGKVIWQVQLPDRAGAIEYIRPFDDSRLVISTSSNTYMFDVKNKKHRIIPPYLTSRDLQPHGETVFFAGPSGLFATPHPEMAIDTQAWKKNIQKEFPAINIYSKIIESPVYIKRQRARAVNYDPIAKKLVVGFKDGLFELNSDGIRPVTYKNQPIYASALEFLNNKLFIGSINNGLMIKNGNDIRQITVNEGLSSNSIIRMKAVNNHLWLFESNTVQVLDIKSEKIIASIDLPSIGGANAYDVIEMHGKAYLTSAEGLYDIPLVAAFSGAQLNSYLNYVVVNNQDTVAPANIKLPYFKNNLLINLSIPWYSPTQTVFFRYRLRGSNHDESWQTVGGPEQDIRFASLMPGNYTFEAFSMVNGITEKNSKTFSFTIRRPWWQQWWFLGSVIVLALAIFYVFYSFRLKQLLKVETIRRNISSDLHDEVGSTLSSINIYAELAKNDSNNKEYLQAIQDNAKDIITQLDDLVWSINPKNDSFEQLINRMQLFAEPVPAAAGIQFKFHYNPSLLKQKLSINKKRNIYLLFKESVNNVLKHSKSNHCTVNFYCRNAYMFLEIKDNGVGFDINNRRRGRSGIDNIMERARQINAKVRIQSNAGKGTLVYIAAPFK